MSYQGLPFEGSLAPLQRCTRCILQPQPTGPILLCILLSAAIFFLLRIRVFFRRLFGCSNSVKDLLCRDNNNNNTTVVLRPLTRPKMPFKLMHRKEVTHSNGSYERKSRGRKLADEMGRGKKFPWYTHRLTHRKRVTCELHDSLFRLMTIKHAISKIERAIEWTLNYYITQSRQKSRCARESHTRPRGPREPRWSLGTREVADKMQ